MSSVFGLKVRPSAATVLPATDPPSAATMCSTIWCLRASLNSTVVSIREIGASASRAVFTSARVSLGKQEPP